MSTTPAPVTAAEEVRAVVSVRAFLTARPSECVAAPDINAERGLLIVGRDTSGLLATGFTAQWLGAAAVKFLADHGAELKPGRCVDLELYHIKPHAGDLRARVKSCQLAPLAPSWIAHQEKLAQPTPEKAPA